MDNNSAFSNSKKVYGSKTGRKRTSGGYWRVYRPEHPLADKRGYVLEHRIVYEEYYKCSLPLNIHIHHINGDKEDNRIENLQTMSNADHMSLHHKGVIASELTRIRLSQSHMDQCRPHSEETKEKISESVTKWWENNTRPMSESAKAKISAYQTGRVKSGQTKEKMRLASIIREAKKRESRNVP